MTDSVLLQANNLDSQKAINAYFEDPTPPDAKVMGDLVRGECWNWRLTRMS